MQDSVILEQMISLKTLMLIVWFLCMALIK